MLHINAALKQKTVCLLMAFFRCTFWLSRSQWHRSCCKVSQLL